jgi:hypothetical protein
MVVCMILKYIINIVELAWTSSLGQSNKEQILKRLIFYFNIYELFGLLLHVKYLGYGILSCRNVLVRNSSINVVNSDIRLSNLSIISY